MRAAELDTLGVAVREGLAAGRIVVLLAEVTPLARKIDRLAQHLSVADQTRAGAMRSAEARRSFVVARTLLARALAAALPGYVWSLILSEQGKPRLATPVGQAAFISLSHCPGWCALALAKTADLGVDIEPIRPLPEIEALSRTVLAPAEQAAVAAADDPTRAFVRLWTRKEAVVKALGIGIDERFARIDVSDGAQAAMPAELARRHRLFDFAIANGPLGALCALAPEAVAEDAAPVEEIDLLTCPANWLLDGPQTPFSPAWRAAGD